MPEDSLFDDPKPKEPEESPEGLTAAVLEEKLQPLRDELAQTTKDLAIAQDVNRRLEARQNAAPTNTVTPTPKTQDQFIDELSTDGQSAIASIVEAKVTERMQQLAPFLEQQNTTQHGSLVSEHKLEIDSKYGAGTWAAEFAPVFDARIRELEQSNPSSLSSPQAIAAEVHGITGLKIDALVDRRANLSKTQTEQREQEDQRIMDKFSNTTGMTGGVHTPPQINSKELSTAEKEFLQAKKDAGFEPDIKSLRASQSSGSTLSDWQAAQKQVEAS